MPELTTIQLTQIDAQAFVRFQKHRALIELLESMGAFDLKNGSITLNFNYLGQIKSVNKQENFNQ